MASYSRASIIDEAEIGVYHCIARCVRRAFLCGYDPVTGIDYNHRKKWLEDRVKLLTENFCVEVISFAFMSNHIHLVVRNRPDFARQLSNEQVFEKWLNIFPNKKATNMHELIFNSKSQVWFDERRQRLSSISWFMRCLCEPIARRANKEDGVTGRFWEGRFKSIAILDDEALQKTSLYVDLNPVRAGVVNHPNLSRNVSIYWRYHELAKKNPTSWLVRLQEPLSQSFPSLRLGVIQYLELAEGLVKNEEKEIELSVRAARIAMGSPTRLKKFAEKRKLMRKASKALQT